MSQRSLHMNGKPDVVIEDDEEVTVLLRMLHASEAIRALALLSSLLQGGSVCAGSQHCTQQCVYKFSKPRRRSYPHPTLASW